jgi:hypothetical protein
MATGIGKLMNSVERISWSVCTNDHRIRCYWGGCQSLFDRHETAVATIAEYSPADVFRSSATAPSIILSTSFSDTCDVCSSLTRHGKCDFLLFINLDTTIKCYGCTRYPYKLQASITHLDLLVVGSFITITSVISPYLLKYSRRLSEIQNRTFKPST